MRGILKILIMGLVLALIGILAIPVVGSIAQQDKLLIGPDAALFHVNGGIQIWVPGADPDVWDLAINISSDQLTCFDAINQSTDQSNSQTTAQSNNQTTQSALLACNQAGTRSGTQSLGRDGSWIVAQWGKITVYRLADGSYQVNNGPQQDGKIDVAIFDPAFTFVSQYNLDPNNPNASTGGSSSGGSSSTAVPTSTASDGTTVTPGATSTTVDMTATGTDVGGTTNTPVSTSTLVATSTTDMTAVPSLTPTP